VRNILSRISKNRVETRNIKTACYGAKKVPKKLWGVNYGNQQSPNEEWQFAGESYGKDVAENCNAVRDVAWMKAKEDCCLKHWI